MAKREQMFRLMNISNFLKSKPNGVTFREVQLYIEKKYKEEEFDNDLAFSEKTFKRDRKLLKELFKLETKFNRSTMLYQIVDEIEPNQTIFDNLLLLIKRQLTKRTSYFLKKDKLLDWKILMDLFMRLKTQKLLVALIRNIGKVFLIKRF